MVFRIILIKEAYLTVTLYRIKSIVIMTSRKTRVLVFFAISAFILSVIFLTLPINLFDGQIDFVEPQREYTINTPLSLSYFVGLGYEEADMQYVESFRLTTKGWITAFLFIFGFPGLIAYRVYLKAVKS